MYYSAKLYQNANTKDNFVKKVQSFIIFIFQNVTT